MSLFQCEECGCVENTACPETICEFIGDTSVYSSFPKAIFHISNRARTEIAKAIRASAHQF